MRKIATALLVFVSVFALWATEPETPPPVLNASASTGLEIHAFMGSMINVSITPLPSTGLEGIPFDLMGSDVWYRSGDIETNTGRLIATWSLRTNVGARTLSITAGPLIQVNKEDGTVPATPQKIFYRLVFTLFYYNQSKKANETKYLYVYSDGHATEFTSEISNYLASTNMPLVSSDQSVRILLVKPTDEQNPTQNKASYGPYSASDRKNGWDSGWYEADISIEITGGS